MPASMESSALHVEGDDDLHTIIHLLARHEIELDEKLGPVRINNLGGRTNLLDSMNTAIRAGTNRSVGFVIDANGSVADVWKSVCNRIRDLGAELPDTVPVDGFVGDAPKVKAHFGVWIMPNNVTDSGKLEHLLETLVPKDDTLLKHAQDATETSLTLGARFPEQDRIKAELHCWLAWQEEPGRPYGTALKAHFFRHDSDVALRFVSWFRKVFLNS